MSDFWLGVITGGIASPILLGLSVFFSVLFAGGRIRAVKP